MSGLIFAIIGPSGSGKSALVDEMVRRFPNHLKVMSSVTTRPKRNAEDDSANRFISKEEFENLIASDALVQWIPYNGQLYGDIRSDVEAIFNNGKCAIRPLVEEGVKNFRNKGFTVLVVKIIPSGNGYHSRSSAREVIDAERSKESFASDIEIQNQFDDGGFTISCNTLYSFIEQHLKIHNDVQLVKEKR